MPNLSRRNFLVAAGALAAFAAIPFDGLAAIGGPAPWEVRADAITAQLDAACPWLHEGDDAYAWQMKAKRMAYAVVRAACYLHADAPATLDRVALDCYMSLAGVTAIYQRPSLREDLRQAIHEYLEQGLPGFEFDRMARDASQRLEVLNQHGYQTGQVSRALRNTIVV